MKKVLVLTASFGDGHNAAANGIREACEATGEAKVVVADLYSRAMPLMDQTVQVGYSVAINRLPWIWNLIFRALDQPGIMERLLWTAGSLKRAMEQELDREQPDVVVSTYPLYGYLFRRIQTERNALRMPFLTVITDSVGVNSAWYRCRSDAFVVPDLETVNSLERAGVDRELLHALGFPISPRFVRVESLPGSAEAPWRLLFMPSTQHGRTIRQIQALLEVPDVEVTILAGRNQRLRRALEHASRGAGDRCRVLGWTDQMPELLASHHAFIGKAGGAIVQEAIAARCPFFVSHVVPGQEEGNIELIERRGVGVRATGSPTALAAGVRGAFADDARVWRGWKGELEGARGTTTAADRVAEFALGMAD